MPRGAMRAAVLLLAAAYALAEAPLLSEREALEAGKKALRERRFDDAVAAFAQSDKAYPAGTQYDNRDDPRSAAIVSALQEILSDLAKRGATPAEHLPYWRFYLDNFPFFNIGLEVHLEPPAPDFDELFLAAAEEECRADDPKGTSDRALLCDRVKGACDAKDAEALLALLEKGWPAAHADHDLCASRTWRVLEPWCSDEKKGTSNPDRADRAWKAYVACFRGAACLGRAASVLGDLEEAFAAATDPRARRWCFLLMQPMGGDPVEDAKFVEALPSCSGPWVSNALARAWAMSGFVRNPEVEDPVDDPAEGAIRLDRMKKEFPGARELGLARFTFLWKSVREGWGTHQEWIDAYLDAWEQEAPDDPYLEWGRFEEISHRAVEGHGLPLQAGDRGTLERLAETYHGDALGAHASVLLADNAAACGEGDLALKRYQEVARFDVSSARLAAPFPSDLAVSSARERLIVYCEHRDPTKLPELLARRLSRGGPFWEQAVCGNTGAESYRDNLRTALRRWTRAGRPEEVLDDYEEEALGGASRSGSGFDIEYAQACLATGHVDRIQATLKVLEGRPKDGELYAETKTLQQFLDDKGRIEREGPQAAVPLLEEALGESGSLTFFFRGRGSPRAHGIIAILRSMKGTDAALAETWSTGEEASVLLASAGDTDESVGFLVYQAELTHSAKELEGLDELLAGAVTSRGEAAAREVLVRAAEWPTDNVAGIDTLLAGFDPEDLWKACSSLPDDAPIDARQRALEQLLRIRRENPWLAYCLEGK